MVLSQLYASAVPAAAATADAATASGDSAGSESTTTAGASSADRSMNSTTTVSSTGSSSSGSTMLAVQQSVLMKMIVTPEGWQFIIKNAVKLISCDGKRHTLQTETMITVTCEVSRYLCSCQLH
jgi:hypothetical protein